MLNKDGNTEDVYSEWPPPYNPEFSSSNEHEHTYNHHVSSSRPEPPDFNPDLVQNVVWDENHVHEQVEKHQTQQRDEPYSFENENETLQERYSSPGKRSWEVTKQAVRATFTKIKRVDDKHQISHKTKEGVVAAYQSTKRVTITASHKLREFDEKHQIVAKSKQKIGQGSSYISRSLRRTT